MKYAYSLLNEAQKEYEADVLWYSRKSYLVAINFIEDFENTVKHICENPKRWRNEYKSFHELGLKKYPYVIIYTIEESQNMVLITAVFHTSRNPEKKIKN